MSIIMVRVIAYSRYAVESLLAMGLLAMGLPTLGLTALSVSSAMASPLSPGIIGTVYDDLNDGQG